MRRAISSLCRRSTVERTSPLMSIASSGRSSFFRSPRMRSITAPARLLSCTMSSSAPPTSVRSGAGLASSSRAASRVGEDRGQRLVELVRDRAGQLAHHGDAHQMRQLAPLQVGFVLGLLGLGDVDEHAADADRHAVLVVIGARPRAQPAQPAVRQDHAEFVHHLLPGERRQPHRFDRGLAIVRMDRLLDHVAGRAARPAAGRGSRGNAPSPTAGRWSARSTTGRHWPRPPRTACAPRSRASPPRRGGPRRWTRRAAARGSPAR